MLLCGEVFYGFLKIFVKKGPEALIAEASSPESPVIEDLEITSEKNLFPQVPSRASGTGPGDIGCLPEPVEWAKLPAGIYFSL